MRSELAFRIMVKFPPADGEAYHVQVRVVKEKAEEFKGPVLDNKKEAEILKNSGNEQYMKGNYEQAIFFYTQTIETDGNNATYYTNSKCIKRL